MNSMDGGGGGGGGIGTPSLPGMGMAAVAPATGPSEPLPAEFSLLG